MALLALEDVSIRYGERPLLDRATLLVHERDRIAIVGSNGSGKSTLLRILAGLEVPDAGRRTTASGLRVGYLDQDPRFAPEKTIREITREGLGRRAELLAAIDGVHAKLADPACTPERLERLLAEQERLDAELAQHGGYDIEHKIDAILDAVGIAGREGTCATLSGGERRRVALARLLIAEPDVLLLDEPTNHLDAETIQWLETFLLESRSALVLVTHDRYFLDRIAERVLELDRAELHESEGGYAEFVLARSARLEREQQAEATRQNLLRRETDWIRRGPPARTTKSKSRIQRYETLLASAPDAPVGDLTFVIPCSERLGTKVLELHGVTKAYGDHVVLRNLDLELGKGERIGVVGPNGAGKSTLLQIALGLLEPDSGRVELGTTVRFSFLDQDRSRLDDEHTVIEAVAGKNDYVFVDGRSMRIESYLESFLFTSAMMRTKVGRLSGGERNRVLIAKLLAIGGNVLVFDEPTNDLDLTTLRVLEEAVCAFAGSALIVSHDRWFLDRVATRCIYIGRDGTHRHHAGDASALLDLILAERQERAAAEAALRAAERTKQQARAPRDKPRSMSRERKELEELPAHIEELEGQIAALDEALADPALYEGSSTERARVDELVQQRTDVQARLERAFARWEELESLLDSSA
ncbi:MAG: ABC-F family ATP-binding cassette domain-containing protein [Planctomycetes bacterium]|nr:ABC-F family ATP-binding cassette domain-containing protein [Planctomycetota bacterium]